MQPLKNWRRVLVSVVLAGSLAFPAAQAHAFGFGWFTSSEPDEEDLIIGEPQNYEIEFVVTGPDGEDLESGLRGASNLWGDRDEPASGASGLLSKARGDYRRLLAQLYTQARYGGTISILIDGREADDIAPDAVLAEPANVLVTVNPGPLFHFGQAVVENQAPPPAGPRDAVPGPVEGGFATGEEARSDIILQAERRAVEAWRHQGHAKAEVAQRRVEAAHDSRLVDARIMVEPGQRAHYGPITVQGTERMDPEFVAWMADLPPGQVYHPDDIALANTRLARLDVFRSQRFQEAEFIDPYGMLPISLIVQERELRRIGIGGSYSTVDGLGLETYWIHRNLFGRAERLRLEARVGNMGETWRPDELTYRAGATFTKPGIYTPDTDFSASLFGEREVLDAYTRTAIFGDAGITHRFNDYLSGSAFIAASHGRYEDEVFGKRDFTRLGPGASLTFDSRDDAADATRGIYAEARAEPFYEFNFGNAAMRATAEARAYYGFGDRFVLAGRVRLGSIVGPDASQLPPDVLFFAGGGGSVRGYGYRNIGVPVGDHIIGGRSLGEASIEARVRVTDSIGAVAFADVGFVGADSTPSFDEDLRVGVGAGLRYLTGLGPIRLDVAVPLDRRRGDPSVAFYVGIGQAF